MNGGRRIWEIQDPRPPFVRFGSQERESDSRGFFGRKEEFWAWLEERKKVWKFRVYIGRLRDFWERSFFWNKNFREKKSERKARVLKNILFLFSGSSPFFLIFWFSFRTKKIQKKKRKKHVQCSSVPFYFNYCLKIRKKNIFRPFFSNLDFELKTGVRLESGWVRCCSRRFCWSSCLDVIFFIVILLTTIIYWSCCSFKRSHF